MSMNVSILVINCGSSSIKFAVIAPETGETFVSGIVERLGSDAAQLSVCVSEGPFVVEMPEADHADAIDRILSELNTWLANKAEVVAVGHRVVHGGETFSGAVRITSEVIAAIESCSTLAPLHNPVNLLGINAVESSRPELPQVAVFDTAFHQTIPEQAYLYAIPYRLYERARIRRYGFHGTSHQYVSQTVAKALETPVGELGMVTLHLGNGCSACAIQGGMSVDTTMGLSPLEGMVMGTRSGNVDPDLPRFLNEQMGMEFSEISKMLNQESGLLGLSEASNDMRTLSEAAEEGDSAARRAIDVFCYRAAKAVMEMAMALDRLDVLVFTGGIGENAPGIREKIVRHLRVIGVQVSANLNADVSRGNSCCISADRSSCSVWVVPTNEELMIAQQAVKTL